MFRNNTCIFVYLLRKEKRIHLNRFYGHRNNFRFIYLSTKGSLKRFSKFLVIRSLCKCLKQLKPVIIKSFIYILVCHLNMEKFVPEKSTASLRDSKIIFLLEKHYFFSKIIVRINNVLKNHPTSYIMAFRVFFSYLIIIDSYAYILKWAQ